MWPKKDGNNLNQQWIIEKDGIISSVGDSKLVIGILDNIFSLRDNEED